MVACKEASTPATSAIVITPDSEEPLNPEQRSQYRRHVGKFQWEAPVGPDCAVTIKELARDLNEPTVASLRRLKHLLRYSKGTLHDTILLQPKLFIDPSGKRDFIIVIPADANSAGCSKTRKSTSGVSIELLGVPVHFASKT